MLGHTPQSPKRGKKKKKTKNKTKIKMMIQQLAVGVLIGGMAGMAMKHFTKPALIGVVNKELELMTNQRIYESKQSTNGIQCKLCGAALTPMFTVKSTMDMYCPVCYDKVMFSDNLGSHGFTNFIDKDDEWLPKYLWEEFGKKNN